ncbi:piggyBac transposable element-derived protein 4-like [Magallana gigas]|uniref:piggyBac transposable element-derived protein 4-like n=1 Tax=Magallana gigas TaxID=29159 RepID=UPI003342D34D
MITSPLYAAVSVTSLYILYKPRKHQTIDEGMIAYKGRHKVYRAKQYIPSKPARWGLKVWLRCDSLTGFCHQFDLYLGREQYRGVAVGQAVVEKLTAGLENKNFHIFYESFFTSVSLAKSLLSQKIFTCGTIVRNRKGFPADLKNVPNMIQGDFLIRYDYTFTRCLDDQSFLCNLTATLWMESKLVAVLSIAASPLDRSTNASRRLKDGTVISVSRLESVGLYQQYFRGVDIFDQLRSKYPVGRPSKKWWKYVLHFLINTAIINAYIIMKKSLPSLPKKKYRQLDYRIALAQQLIGKFRTPVKATSRKIVHPTLRSTSFRKYQ